MLTRSRFVPLAMFLAIMAMIAAVACGSETIEVTKIVEVERQVEVPVTQVVTEEVEVTKVVTETVVEEREVEVTKVVVETETVVETEEVEVTKIVEVMVEAPEGPKDTIVFSDLNWTSAQVQNRIAQYIVEYGYGYPTDLVFGGTLPLFEGLKKGDTHVTHGNLAAQPVHRLGSRRGTGNSGIGGQESGRRLAEHLCHSRLYRGAAS